MSFKKNLSIEILYVAFAMCFIVCLYLTKSHISGKNNAIVNRNLLAINAQGPNNIDLLEEIYNSNDFKRAYISFNVFINDSENKELQDKLYEKTELLQDRFESTVDFKRNLYLNDSKLSILKRENAYKINEIIKYREYYRKGVLGLLILLFPIRYVLRLVLWSFSNLKNN